MIKYSTNYFLTINSVRIWLYDIHFLKSKKKMFLRGEGIKAIYGILKVYQECGLSLPDYSNMCKCFSGKLCQCWYMSQLFNCTGITFCKLHEQYDIVFHWQISLPGRCHLKLQCQWQIPILIGSCHLVNAFVVSKLVE